MKPINIYALGADIQSIAKSLKTVEDALDNVWIESGSFAQGSVSKPQGWGREMLRMCIDQLHRNYLTEEQIAVAMAKCSRSPKPFNEIAQEITEEAASKFHEKYVISYGHSSVAEIAVPNFVFEGVSIFASKILESLPRGAYQEKSTRYQDFTEHADLRSEYLFDNYFIPPELDDFEKLKQNYLGAMDKLFQAYSDFKSKIQVYADKVTEGQGKNKSRIKAFDSLRYILPIGTQTNLGMRLNARDCALLINKLLSSPVPEFQFYGNKLQKIATEQLPSLVRHCDHNDFLHLIQSESAGVTFNNLDAKGRIEKLGEGIQDRNHCLVDPFNLSFEPATANKKALIDVAKAFLVHYTDVSSCQIKMDDGHAKEIIDDIMSVRGVHDPIPDEFGVVPVMAEMVMDYGAYRDLQRHRRCRQFSQWPTTQLGFEIPEGMDEVGLKNEYISLMVSAGEQVRMMQKAVEGIPELFGVPFYMTPLAFRHRTLFEMDLQQAGYMIELRSRPQGHISYRRMVRDLYDGLTHLYPDLMKWIRCAEVPTITALTEAVTRMR